MTGKLVVNFGQAPNYGQESYFSDERTIYTLLVKRFFVRTNTISLWTLMVCPHLKRKSGNQKRVV